MTVSHLSPLPSTGAGAGDPTTPETASRRAPRRPATPPTTRQERREATADLLTRAHASADELESRRLLGEVIRLNMEVAESVAHRFRGRGIPEEDLVQVACLGLVKAAQRFDASRGHDFLSFAVPTIRGEVRRHFRDAGWMVRPPRHLQEVQAKIGTAEADLAQELGRQPRPDELAKALGEDERDVLAARQASGCFIPSSLDCPVRGTDSETTLAERLGDADPNADAAEARVVLAPAVRGLSERDRRILYLRYFEGLNQHEIGAEIGVTQMQVSRLLSRILRELRGTIEEPSLPAG